MSNIYIYTTCLHLSGAKLQPISVEFRLRRLPVRTCRQTTIPTHIHITGQFRAFN